MEENNTIDYTNKLNELNENVLKLYNHLEVINQEQKEKEKKELEQEQKEKKELEKEQKEQEQKKIEEEKKAEEQEQKQAEFYSNIETIALNTDSEITNTLLTDLNSLIQVNIMSIGLLIGIVCMGIFGRYFKK